MSQAVIIEKLKGGSFSSTNVISVDGELRVRKSISNKDNREYGLVRWHSQIRKLQILKFFFPDNVPQILETGVSFNSYYFDIPYLTSCKNYYELLKDSNENLSRKAVNALFDLIAKFENIEFGAVKGGLNLFVNEELKEILKSAQKDLEANLDKDSQNIIIKLSDKIENSIKYLDENAGTLEALEMNETISHGNLTLENVMFDSEKNIPILIDPYAETYTESILGDVSQLMQSSISNYEKIMEIGEDCIDLNKQPKLIESVGINYLNKRLRNYNIGLEDEKKNALKILHAGQFVRMFPFKIDKTPKLAAFFLNHGLDLLLDEKQC
tara:strand:- start:111 stop:1085 length:975 start_codon:yes stop_codon:yes gene_type:complete